MSPAPGGQFDRSLLTGVAVNWSDEIRMMDPDEQSESAAKRAAEKAREYRIAAWAVPLGDEVFEEGDEAYGWWTLLRRAEVTVFGQRFVVFELSNRAGRLRLGPLMERLESVTARRPE